MSDTFNNYLRKETQVILADNEMADMMVEKSAFDEKFAMRVYVADKISETAEEFARNFNRPFEEILAVYNRAWGDLTLADYISIMKDDYAESQKESGNNDLTTAIYKHIKRIPIYKSGFRKYLDEMSLDTFYKMYALRKLNKDSIETLLSDSTSEIEVLTGYTMEEFMSNMNTFYRRYMRRIGRGEVKARIKKVPDQPPVENEIDAQAAYRLKKEKYQALLDSYETGIAPKHSTVKLYGKGADPRKIQAVIRSRLFNIAKYASCLSTGVSITRENCLKVMPAHYYAKGEFLKDYLLKKVDGVDFASRLPTSISEAARFVNSVSQIMVTLASGTRLEGVYKHFGLMLQKVFEGETYKPTLTDEDVKFSLDKAARLAEELAETIRRLVSTAEDIEDPTADVEMGDWQKEGCLPNGDCKFAKKVPYKEAKDLYEEVMVGTKLLNGVVITKNLVKRSEIGTGASTWIEVTVRPDSFMYAQIMSQFRSECRDFGRRLVTGVYSCLPSVGIMGNIQKVLVALVMVYSPLETIRANTLRYLYRLYGPEPWLLLVTYDILDQLTALVKFRGKSIRNKTVESFAREMIKDSYLDSRWVGDIVYICAEAYKRLLSIKMNGGVLEAPVETTDLSRFCTDFIQDQLLQVNYTAGDFTDEEVQPNNFSMFEEKHKDRMRRAVVKAVELAHLLQPKLPLVDAVNVIISRTSLCTHRLDNPLVELEMAVMRDIIQGKYGPYYLTCEDVEKSPPPDAYTGLADQVMSQLDIRGDYATRMRAYYMDYLYKHCGRDIRCAISRVKDERVFDRGTQEGIIDELSKYK